MTHGTAAVSCLLLPGRPVFQPRRRGGRKRRGGSGKRSSSGGPDRWLLVGGGASCPTGGVGAAAHDGRPGD
jgi:hypothetical protein